MNSYKLRNRYDMLTCPGCGAGLALHTFEEGGQRECLEGVLACGTCGNWYPVTNGIPRIFLPGPLRPDDRPFIGRWKAKLSKLKISASEADEETTGQARVQETFGFKWTRTSEWGMEGGSAEMMEQWLLPRYGWRGKMDYEEYMKKRPAMLDAGCGLGREALRMARANPAGAVVGIELSRCVDEAARHARERGVDNVFFIQGDLHAPPLRKGSVDFIIGEGVLHHTPDTRAAFEALVPLLAPGGEIGFYVYRKKAPLREYADDYVRGLVSKLPPQEAWELMKPLTKLGKALSELNAEVDVPEDVDVLGIKAGRHNVQRLVYYSMFKCFWNPTLDFEENVHVNFDWYHPEYAWRHTEEEVRGWVSGAGLEVVHETIDPSGITIRARRGTAAGG